MKPTRRAFLKLLTTAPVVAAIAAPAEPEDHGLRPGWFTDPETGRRVMETPFGPVESVPLTESEIEYGRELAKSLPPSKIVYLPPGADPKVAQEILDAPQPLPVVNVDGHRYPAAYHARVGDLVQVCQHDGRLELWTGNRIDALGCVRSVHYPDDAPTAEEISQEMMDQLAASLPEVARSARQAGSVLRQVVDVMAAQTAELHRLVRRSVPTTPEWDRFRR